MNAFAGIKMAVSNIKKVFDKHKNSKFLYYVRNLSSYILPDKFFRGRLQAKLSLIKDDDSNYISIRVNYYNKLKGIQALKQGSKRIRDLKLAEYSSTYFLDFFSYARYFNKELRVKFFFFDITDVPDEPTIVKSRPLNIDNTNSVLLNLNKVRHFNFIEDTKRFITKKNLLVWRAGVFQAHRMRFMEMYFNHPMCNIGQINKTPNPHWKVDRLTIAEQLDYKFILCIEGNDVASNLKWVMSSNSIAVMPKPSHETWFMEGTLVPGFNYIMISDDYSDLEEKLQYYIDNTEAALQIIRNAHIYINQFKSRTREDLISLLVLQKYFDKTGQHVFGESGK